MMIQVSFITLQKHHPSFNVMMFIIHFYESEKGAILPYMSYAVGCGKLIRRKRSCPSM